MKPNNRENNYDLLRILSAVAVVFIHINQYYMALPNQKSFTVCLCENIIEVFTRFCVPCFFMLSGAFLLSNPKNKNYKSFYKNRFKKIVLPYLIISAGMLIFDICMALIEGKELGSLAEKYLTGNYYKLWFMPVISGLYLLTPLIIRIKEKLSANAFGLISFLWLLGSVAFQTTVGYKQPWVYVSAFAYLGYFAVGSWIYDNLRGRLSAVPFALIAFLAYSLRVFLRMNNLTGIFRGKNVYFYPTIIIGAIAVFIFFSNIKVYIYSGRIANATLYVYLLHTFVFELVLRIIGNKIIISELTTIFIMTTISFSVSLAAGLFITKRKTI